MGKPWLGTSEHQLDDVDLDDEVHVGRQQKWSSRPQCLSGPIHEILLVLVAAFTGASFLLLQRATMVITDRVRHSLLLDMSDVSWMSASSGLTGAIFLLPIAHLADRCPNVSRKAILISAIVLFSLAMGLTTLTSNGIVLDITLGVAGLACSAHIPIMSNLLTSIYAYPSMRRHCVLTFFLAGGNAFSVIFGGLGSGLVITAMAGDWRGSFVYVAVLYAIVAVAGALVIPNAPRTHLTPAITSRTEDCYSLLGLSMGPEGNWRDIWVFLPLACSVGCFIGFFTWEGYTERPLIPESMLECSTLIPTFASILCISMAFFSSLFWVSFFMQDMQQLSPLEVGVRQLPQAVTGLIFSPIVGCWMHKIDNVFILVAAAFSQAGAGALLLFLQPGSSYFAFIFPSMILSTLSMDWARNVAAQYILQVLPFHDQVAGAALLQLVTRLAIPLGIGITSSIWSSRFPTPKIAVTNFDVIPMATLQLPYFHVFIATVSFAAVAVVLAPFTRLGKLGVASTATDPSLPLADTGLKSLNLYGAGDWDDNPQKDDSVPQGASIPRLRIQPRMSSLLGTSFSNNYQRTSTGAASFHLPLIGGSRASGGVSGLGIGFGASDDDDDNKSQRTSTAAMAERVIWLVCEDCGASKRIVEQMGDPERYFYDGNEDEDAVARKTKLDNALTPPTHSSRYSSVYHELETSVADIGVAVDRRRFALVNRPGRMGSLAEENDE